MLMIFKKKLFIAALITTAAVAVILIAQFHKATPVNSTVRIPLFSNLEIEKLDSAKITDSQQGNILRSIYATLLYHDANGKLQAGAAERYSIENNTIHFQFRSDLKTIDGAPITSKDAYLSFKRLLILNSNTHGRLAEFLDCKTIPKKITDECSGLSYDSKNLNITLKSANAIQFLLPMFANPDYSILPEGSVDYADTLKITNFRNTSGGYYIDQNTPEKTVFKTNPSSYLISDRNAQVVEFINNVKAERIQKLEAGEFDAIPTYAFLSKRHLSQFKHLENFNVHKTLPIQLHFLKYTAKGFNSLSPEERVRIAQEFKASFLKEFQEPLGFENTIEYFTIVGEGSLNDSQLTQVITMNESALARPHRKVKIDVFNISEEAGKRIVDRIENTQYVSTVDMDEQKTEKTIDAHTVSSDAGGIDNLSLLAYMQSTGIFNMTQEEFEIWMRDFIDTSDSSARLEKFRELHFRLLKTAKVVPIAIAPYYAIARKPWKFEAYQAFAGTPLWTLKHE